MCLFDGFDVAVGSCVGRLAADLVTPSLTLSPKSTCPKVRDEVEINSFDLFPRLLLNHHNFPFLFSLSTFVLSVVHLSESFLYSKRVGSYSFTFMSHCTLYISLFWTFVM